MILANTEIAAGLDAGLFSIDPAPTKGPTEKPFNTSAHLGPDTGEHTRAGDGDILRGHGHKERGSG